MGVGEMGLIIGETGTSVLHMELSGPDMKDYNVINQVISYWPSYRSEVCCIGPRRSRGPIQLTEDL